MNSRTKGAAGEREVASMLRGYGYKARRASGSVPPEESL